MYLNEFFKVCIILIIYQFALLVLPSTSQHLVAAAFRTSWPSSNYENSWSILNEAHDYLYTNQCGLYIHVYIYHLSDIPV